MTELIAQLQAAKARAVALKQQRLVLTYQRLMLAINRVWERLARQSFVASMSPRRCAHCPPNAQRVDCPWMEIAD